MYLLGIHCICLNVFVCVCMCAFKCVVVGWLFASVCVRMCLCLPVCADMWFTLYVYVRVCM